jgi:hypothetical protein
MDMKIGFFPERKPYFLSNPSSLVVNGSIQPAESLSPEFPDNFIESRAWNFFVEMKRYRRVFHYSIRHKVAAQISGIYFFLVNRD